MKPKLLVVDTLEKIENLQSYLEDKDFVAFDTETTGLTKRDIVIGYSVCAEETEAYYVILAEWKFKTAAEANRSLVIYEDRINKSKELIKDLVSKSLVMHNGVFDCMMIEANFGISLINSLHTDTMILAHLLNENRLVGLKPLSKEYFGITATQEEAEMKASIIANGGAITKDHYELYKADSELIAKYGAKDALLTYKLFYKLVPELYEQGLEGYFYEDECMPLLRGPTYELNTTGLQIDNTALLTLKKTIEAECAEAKAYIYKEIEPYIKAKYPGKTKKDTFNIEAPQQKAWLLFYQLKLEFNSLTAVGKKVCKAMGLKLPYTKAAKRAFIDACVNNKGTPYEPAVTINGKVKKAKLIKDPWCYIACDKYTITKLASRYKWIKTLLEYQKNKKLLSTYIEGVQSRIQYGVIYPSFLQHGTKTGRYSSRNPNFQNLPRNDKRVKQFIVPRPGKVFVGADYSQLEPRVFAYYSQDKRLLEVFNGTDDFYSVIGIEVFDKYDCVPKKEGPKNAFGSTYPKLRDDTKVVALSAVYGTTAFKLARTLDKSTEDTQTVIDNYFEKFPNVKQMMLDKHEEVKEKGYVTNLFGRPRRIPEALNINKIYGPAAHSDLPSEARTLLNQAVNSPIQGTGGALINRASIKMHQNKTELKLDAKLVIQVHDSLVYECNPQDAETISLLLQDAMENTNVLEGIRLEAIPKIGKNLSEV